MVQKQNEKEQLSIEIPENLKELIEKTKSVPRYEDPRYPEGMVHDTLYDHLHRLVEHLGQLNLQEPLKSKVIRTAWIHDLPEVFLGDQAAVLKADGVVVEQDEASVAKRILLAEDWLLYQNHEKSSAFLKGKSEEYDEVGLIVKVMDSIEGNLYFHRHLNAWILYGHTELPPDTAVVFTFTQKEKYSEAISAVREEELKTLLAELLEWEILQIKELWTGHENLIPENIRNYLT